MERVHSCNSNQLVRARWYTEYMLYIYAARVQLTRYRQFALLTSLRRIKMTTAFLLSR